uniref:RING-type E3 ubiquitin transferase n=2 Tax=Octopus bimaculoides TaxID=37653 RepID=A0A0L8GHJ4_OCTBM
MELAELGRKYQLNCSKLQSELQEAQNEIKFLRSRLMGSSTGATSDVSLSQENSVNKSQEANRNGQYRCIKTILIWEGGNCRVMAYSPFLGVLVVSQPSSIPLFQGFGVRKISTVDFRTTEYIPLHSKLIRSMSFHPTYSDGLLLSCAMDKKIKLTSLISNTVVQQYEVPLPAWSCVWNTDDHNYFFAGIQNGLVLEYDVRKTDTFIQQINTEGSRSPVVSLQYIPAAPFAHFRAGGLLVGQLDRISFYERKPNNKYEVHLLPLEGNLTSLFFETHTRQLLASFRNSTKFPKVRHLVCEMTASVSDDHNICSCNVVQTFHGSSPQTLLSRTSLIQHPIDKNQLLICASEELACAINIWDGKTFQYVQKLSCGSPVLDICSISTKDNHYLLALTEKQVKLHKWSES